MWERGLLLLSCSPKHCHCRVDYHAIFAFCLLFLVGCATSPVEEARVFAEASKAVAEASALMFDSLAVAERKRHEAIFEANPSNKYTFVTADAAFFSTIGEPPNTEALRRSLAVVTSYADLLVSLMEAKNVASTKSQLVTVGNNLAQIGGFAAGATAVAALDPLIEHALRAASLAEARRLTLEGAPAIDGLIDALKDAAPEIFNALIFLTRRNPLPAYEQLAQVAAARTVVSNFIVLLDRLQTTFDLLQAAYSRPGGRYVLSELATETGRLRADVEAVRKAFVALQ
ncbi:MAG: hypothetical protein KF810_07150 [Rhizobiaceae bacterium]|nr:hypothetical protein [Rhizobiaceae bacterium]